MTVSIVHENLSNTYTLKYDNKIFTGFEDIKHVRDKIEEIENGRRTKDGTNGQKSAEKE